MAYMPLLVGKGNWRKTVHRDQLALLSAGQDPELRFPLRGVLGGAALAAGIGLAYCLARRRGSPVLPGARGASAR